MVARALNYEQCANVLRWCFIPICRGGGVNHRLTEVDVYLKSKAYLVTMFVQNKRLMEDKLLKSYLGA